MLAWRSGLKIQIGCAGEYTLLHTLIKLNDFGFYFGLYHSKPAIYHQTDMGRETASGNGANGKSRGDAEIIHVDFSVHTVFRCVCPVLDGNLRFIFPIMR
jgi:hypothetical protein